MKKINKKTILLFSIALVALTTFAYSALATSLAITSNVKFKVLADIRVDSIKILENGATNGAMLEYESRYNIDSITSGFTLPNANSEMSYKFKITNSGDIDQVIYDSTLTSNINGTSFKIYDTNNNEISVSNLKNIIIPKKTEKEFIIKYTTTNPSNEVVNAVNHFDYKKIYRITYDSNGGSQVESQIKYEGINLTLRPAPTKTGYTFKGWSKDNSTVHFDAEDTYTIDDDEHPTIILYAIWEKQNYLNVQTNKYYLTLKDALAEVQTGQTIRAVTSEITETQAPSLGNVSNVKFDLAGNKVILNGVQLKNYGTLDIYSSVSGGIIEGTGNVAAAIVANYGTLTTSGTTGSQSLTIRSNSSNNNRMPIYTETDSNTTLYTNTTLTNTVGTSNTRYLVYNKATLTIEGANLSVGSISSKPTNDRGIANESANARTIINSGTITTPGITIINGASGGTGTTTPAIQINGTTSGTTITSTASNTLYLNNAGRVEINGGTITSSGAETVMNHSTGTVDINGGTITNTASSSGNPVYNYTTGTINIDGSSTTITATAASAVYNVGGGTINIDDGNISSSGAFTIYNYSTGTVNINGGVLTNTSTASNKDAIRNRVGGTINIDGSSTTISSTNGAAINNGGIGEINIDNGNISSSATSSAAVHNTTGRINITGGTINSSGSFTIYNYSTGTIDITGGTITNTTSASDKHTVLNQSSGTINIDGNDTVINSTKANTIYNNGTGTINIDGGTISKTTTSGYSTVNNRSTGVINMTGGTIVSDATVSTAGITNYVSGTVNVSGGSVTGYFGIYNSGSGIINVSGEDTEITGRSDNGIRGNTGTVTISGGTVSGNTSGVTATTGTITVTGGTVTAKRNGIYITDAGTLTLGTNETPPEVSITSPEITSTATSSYYGINVASETTFNFYDGIVTARSNSSLNRDEDATPTGYVVVKTNNNNKETAILKPVNPMSVTTPQSLSSDYSTSNQDVTFTKATGAAGNVTYTIKSQKQNNTDVSNFSIVNEKIRVAANTPAGTYTIVLTATAEGDSTYAPGSKDITITFTVNKVDAVCPSTITAYTGTYDGQSHTITIGNPTGGTLEYKTSPSSETWDTNKPTRTNQGTTNVYIRVHGDENHNNKTCSDSSITINKKELTVTADDISMTYGDSAPTFTYVISGAVTGETPVSGTATITVTNSNDEVVTVNNTLGAGTYTITPSGLTVNDNYTINYVSGTLTINKATPTCPTVTAYEGLAENAERKVSVTGGVPSSAIRYQKRPASSSSYTDYGTVNPGRTSPGITYIRVYMAETDNYTALNCYTDDGYTSYISLSSARIDFNLEGGTKTAGNNPIYVAKNGTAIYTGIRTTAAATLPTVTKTGWTFAGWYTGGNNPVMVIDANGVVQASVSGWTDANKKWLLTSTSNTENTNPLYAHYVDDIAPTKPIVTLSYRDGSGTYTSGTWTNKLVRTRVTTVDEGSGVASIPYNTSGSTWTAGTSVKHSGTTYTKSETWTNTDGRVVTVKFKAIDNNNNESEESDPVTIKYDLSGPTITASDIKEGTDLSITLADQYSGVVAWQVTSSSTEPTSGWTDITNTASTTVTKTGLTEGTHYVWAKDEVGNVRSKSIIVSKTVVTANSNGGSISSTTGWTGTGNTATKSVTYNGTYGTLPTVSKTGYTLVGWAGKNLFNVETVVHDHYINKSNGESISHVSSSAPWAHSDYIMVEGGKTYTFNPNSTAGSSNTAHAIYDENKYFISSVGTGQQTITMPANARYVRVSYRESNSTNIQFEEGSIATTYEPFTIIESSTSVTKTENHNIYAIWIPKEYSITYNLNDGINNANNPSSYTIETNEITLQAPTKTGYNFTGWTGSNGNTPSTSVSITQGSTGDKTYTANWSEKTATLTYNSNGYGTAPSAVIMKYTTATTVASAITADGCVFTGWNTEADGSGTAYEPGDTIKAANTIPTTTTLYAQWTKNKYYLTYDYQDSYTYSGKNVMDTGFKVDTSKYIKFDVTFVVPEVGHRYSIYSNYSSYQRNMNLELTNENRLRIYLGQNGVTDITTDVLTEGDVVNAVFIWDGATSDYSFVATGGISESGNQPALSGIAVNNTSVGRDYRTNTFSPIEIRSFKITEQYEYDTAITLPSPTKAGYTYTGWYSSPDSETPLSNYRMPAGDTTIYAQNEINSYTITYNLDGGTVETANPVTYNVESETFTLNNPTKTDYIFTGWTGSNGDTPETSISIEKGTTGNKTYTANYVPLYYEVELDNQHPSIIGTGTIYELYNSGFYLTNTEGVLSDEITTLSGITVPSKYGYTFGGYYTEGNGSGTKVIDEDGNLVSGTSSTLFNKNTTLYAYWIPNSYTVTANPNGGSIVNTTDWTGTGNSSTKSITYDTEYGTLPNATNAGYTLKGWSLLPDGYTEVEYIESTGTQYINTDVQIFNKENHEIMIDFLATEFYNYNQLFGSVAYKDRFESWIYNDGRFASRYNDVLYGDKIGIFDNTRYRINLIKNGTVLFQYIDDGDCGSNTVTTNTSTTKLTLFKSGSDYSKLKVYRARLYMNGEIVRDFIPCINESTDKVGLYDLVDGVFYGNAATGDDFIAGNERLLSETDIFNNNYNTTIYAKWDSGYNTLTLNNQNATTSGTSEIYTQYNGGYYLTETNGLVSDQMTTSTNAITTPTKTGYSFDGYYTEDDVKIIDYTGHIVADLSTTIFDSDDTVYAHYVDDIAPTIVTATPSTILDKSNYVILNATDAGSQVIGYNITSTNTEPTDWIPYTSVVLANTETKYEDNAAWARIFHHNSRYSTDSVFTSSDVQTAKSTDRYSMLNVIDNFKVDNTWEFLLQYPEVEGANRWTQTANPTTYYQASTSSGNLVTGYTPVGTPTWATLNNGNTFGGLELSNNNASSRNTYIDGITGHSNWYFAIGAYTLWRCGIPGPGNVVSSVNLWSRIDTLNTTTSSNLTRRIGDISANGTYYVWVKDAAGNTASRSVSITYVDNTPPTVNITSTTSTVPETATLKFSDNEEVVKYYWGTTNPETADNGVTFTDISNQDDIQKTVSSAGTYYFTAIDEAGNISHTSKVYNPSPIYKAYLYGHGGTLKTSTLITSVDAIFNNGNQNHNNSANSSAPWKTFNNGTPITGNYSGTWGSDYYQFNGTSTYLNLGVINNWKTIEVSFKLTETPTARMDIIGNWNGGGGGIYIAADGKLKGQAWIDSVGDYVTIDTSVNWDLNKKYVAALTYNGSKLILYLNGEEKASTSASGNIGSAGTNTQLGIGCNPNSSGTGCDGGYFKGRIYYAAVHNAALGAQQIQADCYKEETYQSNYVLPSDPGRGGHTFAGWYNNAPTAGNQITTSTTYSTNGDTEIYPHWTPNIYKVAFNKDGGSNGTSEVWYKYNTVSDGVEWDGATYNGVYYYANANCTNPYSVAAITIPTKTGYTFGGYYTAKNGQGTQYVKANGEFTNNIYTTIGNKTLYAKWTPNIYKVTFNKAGGSNGTSEAWYKYNTVSNGVVYNNKTYNNVYYYADANCTNPYSTNTISTPTRTGYTFGGYYGNTNGQGTQYITTAGGFINNIYQNVGNQTVYAKWTANTYKLYYNRIGSTLITNTSSSNNNLLFNLDGDTTKYGFGQGYAWFGNSKLYNETDAVSKSIYNLSSSTEEYVPFNGSSTYVDLGEQNSFKTMEITISYPTLPTKTGFETLIGNKVYYNSSYSGAALVIGKDSASDPVYVQAQIYKNGNRYYASSSTTLEANKKYRLAMTYDGSTLKLYVNGVLEKTKSITGPYDTPANSGHMVIGCTTSGGTTCTNHRFTGRVYSVAVHNALLSDSQISNDVYTTQAYGSNYNLPTPIRVGFNFDGWYDAASGGNKLTSSNTYTSTSDKEIYARWTPKTGTVNFNANGHGTAPSSVTITYSSGFAPRNMSNIANYHFKYWTLSSSDSGTTYDENKPFRTIYTMNGIGTTTTLYAQWQKAYVISLNGNGATSNGSSAVYEVPGYGWYIDNTTNNKMSTSKNAVPILPTRTNYVFNGYYTAASGGTKIIDANGFILSNVADNLYNSDTTLYAQWTSIGGSGGSSSGGSGGNCYYNATKGTSHATLKAALDNAKTGSSTIELLCSVTDTTTTSTNAATITLKLNGNTINRGAGNIGVGYDGNTVYPLTVKGPGNITFSTGHFEVYSTLRNEGATISTNSSTSPYLISVRSGAKYIQNSGSVKSTNNTQTLLDNHGSIEINGGTIENPNGTCIDNKNGIPYIYRGSVIGKIALKSSYSGSSFIVGTTSGQVSVSEAEVKGSQYAVYCSNSCSLRLNNGRLWSGGSSSVYGTIDYSTSRDGYHVSTEGSSGDWNIILVSDSSSGAKGVSSSASTNSIKGTTGTESTSSTKGTTNLMKAPLTASDVSYDNSNTNIDCDDAQCALDKIKDLIGE